MRRIFVMLAILMLIAFALLSGGCKNGQFGTIMSPSLGGAFAASTAGYQYYKNGTVDINDTVTAANLGMNIGDITRAVDSYQFNKRIRKMEKRR